MSIKPVQNQFNGGEISPLMDGRFDLPVYQYSADIMSTFIPLSEGCFKRRGGTHFVSSAKTTEPLTLNIITSPEDADIEIEGSLRNSFQAAYGDEISYKVSAEYYNTKEGSIVIKEDTDLAINLVSQVEMVTVEVVCNIEGADIYLNGQIRDSITVGKNATVTYRVKKDGYRTVQGQVVASSDKTVDVTLKMIFEIIPIPSDALVTINGEERSSIEVDVGDNVEWMVAYKDLASKSGAETINVSASRVVSLGDILSGTVFLDSTTAGIYETELPHGLYRIKLYGAGGGSGGGSWGSDHHTAGAGGGSGAGIEVLMVLNRDNYKAVVGKYGEHGTNASGGGAKGSTGGSSTFGTSLTNYIVAGGGTGGSGSLKKTAGSPTPGVGGSYNIIAAVSQTVKAYSGNSGKTSGGGGGYGPNYGGASVYDGTTSGIGAGGTGYTSYDGRPGGQNGYSGYVQITLEEVY